MKIANSIAAVLVLFFAAHSAHALDPSLPVNSYVRARFSDESGLSSHVIKGIAQSRDGFLWLSLGSGQLARFDGYKFTTLPVSRAGGIALGPDGDLWVGSGATLLQIPAAASTQYGPLQATRYEAGPSTLRINHLRFLRNGVLMVGTNQGLYRFASGAFSSLIPQVQVQRIEETANGNILVTTTEGFLEWDGSRAEPHSEIAAQLGVKGSDIFHVLEDSRGISWICTVFGVARRVGGSIEKLQPWGPKAHAVYRAYEEPKGNVWLAGEEGLFRATAAGLELAAANMKVNSMYSDRDGNLWIGTNGDGLYRFKDPTVKMFTTAEGLPGNVPMAVLTDHNGVLWIGFNCGGLVRFDGQNFHIYNEKDGLLNSCVFALAEDANDDLWIGTYGGGAFRLHNGSFTQYSKAQGLISDSIVGMLAARDGSLWFRAPEGVSRLRDGQVRNYTNQNGLASNRVRALYEDRNGSIWAGSDEGIDRFEGDRFVKVATIPTVAALPVGDDPHGLYVTLQSRDIDGLFRLEKDRLTKILFEDTLFRMVKTNEGELWFSGGNIIRVPAGRIEQPRRHDEVLDYTTFNRRDGLATTECSSGQPNSAFTPDGKLWIATVQGLAMLDVPRLRPIDQKPVIYMGEITVGRNTVFPGKELVLAPGTSHTELRFDAIEITSPEKQSLQYRLDGVDSEWLDIVDPPGHAVYSTLPPGTHAFHVRASNRDGIWDQTGIVYLITQKPFFYQTTWFRVAMIATGLLLVVALYRLRLRQATAKLNVRFDERLSERTRIARELHDTLLQTIQGSKLVADDALDRATDFAHLHGKMEQLSRWLGQATQEGRAALNSLRTSSVETNDLAVGLRRATEECSVDKSIAVKFSVTGGVRDLHPIPRDEVYRIGYEAIRNACEHSSATALEVSLSFAQDLTVRVKDNGAGIEPAVVAHGREGHFGLRGMRERAERIGSKFTLNSGPNSGTEISLVVPGSVIYRKPSTTRFARLKYFFSRRDVTDESS